MENHAGIVRVFQATSPIIVDHTPPNIDNVSVSVEVVREDVNGSIELQEDVTVTWTSTEETSEINYCTCAIGMTASHAIWCIMYIICNIYIDKNTIYKCIF